VAPGEVFGELTGFGDFPRESFAEATEPACVWKIPARTFQALLASRPDLLLAITKQIGGRFKSVETRVESLVFRDVRSRVAGILLELAQRFGRARDGAPGRIIDLRLTQAELGTLIGATRQSVNESLGDFSEAGWITRDGRHTVVLDEEALRRAADGAGAGAPAGD
jgi:CRP-like cAMP-binding protein